MLVALVEPTQYAEGLEQRVRRGACQGNLANAFRSARTGRTPSINRSRTISARLRGRRARCA